MAASALLSGFEPSDSGVTVLSVSDDITAYASFFVILSVGRIISPASLCSASITFADMAVTT